MAHKMRYKTNNTVNGENEVIEVGFSSAFSIADIKKVGDILQEDSKCSFRLQLADDNDLDMLCTQISVNRNYIIASYIETTDFKVKSTIDKLERFILPARLTEYDIRGNITNTVNYLVDILDIIPIDYDASFKKHKSYNVLMSIAKREK